MTKVEVITAAGVTVGVIWLVVAGTLWQFLPIGAAIFVARIAVKALEEKPASEPKTKPTKGKAK